jgi:hypothetical protein
MTIASPTLAPADDPIRIDREVEIERLANLESIDYEVTRNDAAAELGVRTQWLDKAVKKKRRALGLESRNGTAPSSSTRGVHRARKKQNPA